MIGYPLVKKHIEINDEKELLNYADIEEALRLGLAEVVELMPRKALLVHMKEGGAYLLCASDCKSAVSLMKKLPKDEFYILCLHGAEAIEFAKKEMGMDADNLYYQFIYPGSSEDISKHMVCNEGYDLDVCHPGEEVFPEVLANYDLVPEEDLKKDFHNPAFLGGFTEGKFACFIGLHGEGAMGLLRVFPQYRRRGYAEKIYSTLIYDQIKRGALPYCQVDVTNDASIHLQNKLGFVKADQIVAWLVHEA